MLFEEKVTSAELVGVVVDEVANLILHIVDHRVNGCVKSQCPNPRSGDVLHPQGVHLLQ